MGIDVKNMKVCIERFLNLLMTTICTIMKKYPVVSGILLFLFLLYIFLPSLFTFLVFFLPTLVFLGVVFRLIFRIHQQNLKIAKGDTRNYVNVSPKKPTSVEDDHMVDKRETSSTQPLSIRRRNAKEKDKQVHLQEGVEEKDVFPTIPSDDLIDKTALVEENPKEIREVKVVDSLTDRAESSSAACQQSRPECGDASERGTKKSNGSGGEIESESSEDGEDEDEEEAHEDRNKAVEWTEDDQKNLMDLGISEMERNKRLESLIAKRKARKLLSIQVRRTLMNIGNNDPCSQLASILIPRNNPFPANSSGSSQVSPTPGSAPSVLLPMHNPFDIPYDPQEEKPNLSGGSFEEEFTPGHQKETMFCRHESFSLGGFSTGSGEFDQSRRETFHCPNFSTRQRVPEIPEFSRLRIQSGGQGKEDPSKIIQTESSEEDKPIVNIENSHDHAKQQSEASEEVLSLVDIEEAISEVYTTESNLGRDITGGSSSSSLSEVNVPFTTPSKHEILKSLSFSAPRNIGVDSENNAIRNEILNDGSPSSLEKKRPEERFFYVDKAFIHTPTHSIASDLQVEVSEVSSNSPSLTVDGTISPPDGESLVYDGEADVEKEANSRNEELWVASSRLSSVEENESRSREIHEVSEQDIIEVGFSRMNHKSEDPVPSDMLPEKVFEQDIIDTSVSSSNIELPESIHQAHSTDFIGKDHDAVQPPISTSEALSTENLDIPTLENAQQSTENSESHPSPQSNNEILEERSDIPVESAPEANAIYDTNACVVFAHDDNEILEFIKDTYGEALIAMENKTKPVEITVGNSGVPENESNSNLTEYFEGEFTKQGEQGSNSTEEGVVEVGSSGADKNFNDPSASVIHPETVDEQGPEKSQEEHQTLLESCKPTEENVNSRPTADSEAEPKNLAKHNDMDTPSRPIERMDTGESIQDRGYEQGAVDVGFSGASQSFNDPIPSTILVVEEVPVALSSSSSPKADTDKIISTEQASSSSIEPDTLLKVQKSKEEIVPSYDEDLEKLEETSNPPTKATQELNSIYSVKDSEVPANDDIYSEAQILAKEENSADVEHIEGQSGKMSGDQTILDSFKPVENNDALESSQECEQDIVEVGISVISPSADGTIAPVVLTSTVEGGHSGLDPSFTDDPIPPALLPEVLVEQVPIISTSSSSPKSVLHKECSIDQASISSFDLELHPQVQQTETGMEESNLLNELPIDNSTTESQNAPHLTEDSMAPTSNSGNSGNLQEPFTAPGTSTKEDNLNCINNSASNEREEILNSKSVEDGEGQTKLSINQVVLINPGESSDVSSTEGPRGALEQLTDNEAAIATTKPMEQNENSRTTKENEEFGESIKSKDVGDISMLTNSKDDLVATGVVEGESKNVTAYETNVGGLSRPVDNEEFGESIKSKDIGDISMLTNSKDDLDATGVVEGESKIVTAYETNVGGLSRPVEQNDDSRIPSTCLDGAGVVEGESKNVTAYETNVGGLSRPVEQNDDSSTPSTSIEREKTSEADPGRSIEEANIISNENEGEPQRSMRSMDVSEQSENNETADSRTVKTDDGKAEAEAVASSSQPVIGEHDDLNDTKNNEETTKVTDHENVVDLSRTDQNSDSLDHVENNKVPLKI